MLIRLATAADAQPWQAMRLEALAAHPEAYGSSVAEEAGFSPDVVAARLTDPLNRVWVAERDGELIATATARREMSHKARHRCNLFAMYVKPASRGQGVASQLVDAIKRSARTELGADWLQLSVQTGNVAAVALYARAGFVVWGTERDSLRVGEAHYDEYHMALDLRR
ncbi:GNAT family N-acetyltransferase [Chitinimonas sp. BJYL2]|uniref:GNAT family N-acetyltransferase n=1 Tax=Chitinimonas sp. BJYL2 TaxID=2976696 RepID=UPI0022B35712|nr:GNAT family N-acetyltransferase [Chitinimonas sp. BJYL2]